MNRAAGGLLAGAESKTDSPSAGMRGSCVESPPTEAEVELTISVLERLLDEPDALVRLAPDTRRALLVLAGRLSRPTRHERERVTKAMRRFVRSEQHRSDLELRATAAIRESQGPLERSSEAGPREPTAAIRESQGPLERSSEAGPGEPTAAPPPRGSGNHERRLARPQSCYVCKRDYHSLHFFYDAMCEDCAELNFRKRSESADLSGRVALVTGGRIKIGYHTVLRLLRAGARVITTSRFPHDAAQRYAREPDHSEFAERLSIFGLDLRYLGAVEGFSEHLRRTEDCLDILINNAAQTVHRPPAFYAHLLNRERLSLGELPHQEQALLAGHHALLERARLGGRLAPAPFDITAGDASGSDQIMFPLGRFDADGQQLDLRPNNSWRLKAEEVSTAELVEVHLVNAIGPFILVSRLKELMSRGQRRDRHVVNVSAMEGVFARRTKTDRHPHTNMAKASLNMLTRTSAKDFVRDGIHMNSVDTGWVTDEDPYRHAVRKRASYDFNPPLDAIDGAARVTDPIFVGHRTGEHPFGQFFKDYRPSEW